MGLPRTTINARRRRKAPGPEALQPTWKLVRHLVRRGVPSWAAQSLVDALVKAGVRLVIRRTVEKFAGRDAEEIAQDLGIPVKAAVDVTGWLIDQGIIEYAEDSDG